MKSLLAAPLLFKKKWGIRSVSHSLLFFKTPNELGRFRGNGLVTGVIRSHCQFVLELERVRCTRRPGLLGFTISESRLTLFISIFLFLFF